MIAENPFEKQERQASPRIAYLLRMYPRFSQTFVVNEILELERQGLDVRIVSLRLPNEGMFHESVSRVRAAADYLPDGLLGYFRRTCTTHLAWARRSPEGYLRALRTMVSEVGATRADLLQAGHLLAWTAKHKIDHVHVHFGTNEATVALLAHLVGGLSYSLTLHAFDIFRDDVNKSLLARKINASRFTVTVSRYNRRYLVDQVPGLEADKVRVNYNGIDLEKFGADQRPRATHTLLSVGRLIEKKGFTHLIAAVKRLRDRDLEVTCKIVGEGRQAKTLGKQIRRLGLDDCVELTGPLKQEQVRELIQGATCFVLPCVRAADGNIDALPTVLLEALASGCPTISTRLSGIPEIIEHGRSGLLVTPGDEVELATAIRQVLSSRELQRHLAEQGAQRAAERFDIRRNVAVMHKWLVNAAQATVSRAELTGRPSTASVDRGASVVRA